MGYTMIFETKIVKLENGDLIHFSLSGCNNDTAGRSRNDFRAKIYTPEEWEEHIRYFEDLDSYGFDLKIYGKERSYADYGKHLRRMTKRAMTFDELVSSRRFYGSVYDGITFYPENGDAVEYSANDDCEINNIVYGVMYGRIQGHYRVNRHLVKKQAEVIDAIKSGHVKFMIGKE